MAQSSNTGRLLNQFHTFCDQFGTAPYFHVSDPRSSRKKEPFVYIRMGGHPDHIRLEKWLSRFEDGAAFRMRSDGLGAIVMALNGAANMQEGNREIIRIFPLYGGTIEYGTFLAKRSRYDFVFHDYCASDPDLLEKIDTKISRHTAAVIFEVAGNPTLTFPDVEGIVRVCKNHRKGRPLIMCDNTFLFGLFKPFQWGVDVAVASDTKYFAGESAWSAGHCGVSRDCMAQYPEFWEEANLFASLIGGTLGPFEAWVMGKFSVKDIKRRIALHSYNAMQVAQFLEAHPAVERVIYPGLPSYPARAQALKYLVPLRKGGSRSFGGMIAFYIKGNGKTADRFLRQLALHSHIQNKASLAGPDDMIESPFSLSHASMDPSAKARCGITENLFRLSVGRVRPVQETLDALDRPLRTISR